MNSLVTTSHSALIKNKPEYAGMLENIQTNLPSIDASSEGFYKSHSQFMNVTLDVTAITPIRTAKHILAEISRTRAALQEAYINLRKNDVYVRKAQKKLLKENDEFKYELLEIKILKLTSSLETTQNHVAASVRKLNFFTNQYKEIMAALGKDVITEEDYEREEVRYHIMTFVKQALTAAHARGGVIDEGNLIYAFDLGINQAHAKTEIKAYIDWETELFAQGKAPTHEATMGFISRCADLWADCPRAYAESRGLSLIDTKSLNLPALKKD